MQSNELALLKTKRTKIRLIKSCLLLLLLVILLFPSIAFSGARNGLLLWWDTLLPTLLPFMIISGLIIRLRITKPLCAVLYPLFRHLLPITKDGCYPVFIGFLAGVPIGAKTTADLYSCDMISRNEAQMLCAFCNNASPMFILGFIASAKLGMPSIGIHLLLILYLSSYLSSLLWYLITGKKQSLVQGELTAAQTSSAVKAGSLSFSLVDDSILCAFEVVTKVGGYIVLFSVLASFISSLPFIAGPVSAILTGMFEITTGIDKISQLSANLDTKIILMTTVTAFGGLSGFAQTKSVLSETNLSALSYCLCKCMTTGIALLLTILYTKLF